MTFDEYQQISRKNITYPRTVRKVLKKEHNFLFPTLGIAGEAGELVEKIKKVVRDKDGKIDEAIREEIVKEMGDLLWYMAQLASELGISFNVVAKMNLKKLVSRRARGVIQGSGDNR